MSFSFKLKSLAVTLILQLLIFNFKRNVKDRSTIKRNVELNHLLFARTLGEAEPLRNNGSSIFLTSSLSGA